MRKGFLSELGVLLDDLNVVLGGEGAPPEKLTKAQKLAAQRRGEAERNLALERDNAAYMERLLLSPTNSINRGKRSAKIIELEREEQLRLLRKG